MNAQKNILHHKIYIFECLVSLYNIVIKFTFVSGTVGFFVKHVKTGMCIIDTRIIQADGSWGNLSFVELFHNCLDPAAQFRFRDNGAMLNLKRPGCLFPLYRAGSGHFLDMFYLYVNSEGLDTQACSGNVDKPTDPAITQTSWGGLSVKYRSKTQCAVRNTNSRLRIDTYIGLTTSCDDAEDKRFNFGKFRSLLRAYYTVRIYVTVFL